MTNSALLRLLLGIAVSTCSIDLNARGFRAISPIANPALESRAIESTEPATAIPRAAVASALDGIVSAWNNGQIGDQLSADFYDKTRLIDTLESDVPRDARLQLLSVRAVQTLSQQRTNDPEYGAIIVSQVSAVALTQLEFNDPDSGEFMRLEGENEFLLEIRQRQP